MLYLKPRRHPVGSHQPAGPLMLHVPHPPGHAAINHLNLTHSISMINIEAVQLIFVRNLLNLIFVRNLLGLVFVRNLLDLVFVRIY